MNMAQRMRQVRKGRKAPAEKKEKTIGEEVREGFYKQLKKK